MSQRSKDDREEFGQGGSAERPSKVPRTFRACIQCRSRKQKCEGQSDVKSPCRRCCQLGATCSFTTSPLENEVESIAITNQKVGKLQLQMRDHNKRIEELEQTIRDLKRDKAIDGSQSAPPLFISSGSEAINIGGKPVVSWPSASRDHSAADSVTSISREIRLPAPTPISPAPPTDAGFSMDAVNLDTPMSTLRNIATLSKEGSEAVRSTDSMAYDPILPLLTWKEYQSFGQDPVAHGLSLYTTTERLTDMEFQKLLYTLPPSCPLSLHTYPEVSRSRSSDKPSPLLISLYRWSKILANSRQVKLPLFVLEIEATTRTLHECYPKLVSLLDTSMSRLLLQPNLSDVKLDHIRCLLLYIQWMPVEQRMPGVLTLVDNDVSAWSVLGLAIRYSIFLGLDRSAVAPFVPSNIEEPKREDLARLRVWINIMTCDTHLMLSAGLPASIDPVPVSRIVKRFASHKDAVQPHDSRVAAVCDLVMIVRTIILKSGNPLARALDPESLKDANAALDEWESHPHSMPWTSIRWYRLALNSTCLGPALSPSKTSAKLDASTVQALEISVAAASETIYAISEQSSWSTWPPTSISSLTRTAFTISEDALFRFRFAVDSAWITHSFAAVFLVLCYARKAIDDELQITHQLSRDISTLYPKPPRKTSLFYRMISLASQIFDAVSRTSDAHPAADYRTIINNVFSTILKDEPREEIQVPRSDDVDGLFEMMFSSGFNWQGSLFMDNSRGMDV
ncbi:C6 finger domain protein [Rutstroemia sp. NJR-2017a BVV2]|nr:C6 finger domain protein [Rutstroemia sp. NJR-2017a BVV2]